MCGTILMNEKKGTESKRDTFPGVVSPSKLLAHFTIELAII